MRCPASGDANPENLSIGVSLGGHFLDGLLADKVSLPTIKEYVLATLYQEQASLGCNACGYRGPWERGRLAETSEPERSST